MGGGLVWGQMGLSWWRGVTGRQLTGWETISTNLLLISKLLCNHFAVALRKVEKRGSPPEFIGISLSRSIWGSDIGKICALYSAKCCTALLCTWCNVLASSAQTVYKKMHLIGQVLKANTRPSEMCKGPRGAELRLFLGSVHPFVTIVLPPS